jgi:hypothetical protein
MNGYYSEPSALKRIRSLDDNAVTAHKIARLKISDVARKKTVS